MSIALIPSLALLGVGGITAASLLVESNFTQTWSDELTAALPETEGLISAIQRERMLAMAAAAGNRRVAVELASASAAVDGALAVLAESFARWQTTTDDVRASSGGFEALAARLPIVRASADGRRITVAEAYDFYNGLMELIITAAQQTQEASPDAEASIQITESSRWLRVSEAIARSNALAFAYETRDGGEVPMQDFLHQSGFYRAEVAKLALDMDRDQKAAAADLMNSAGWVALDGFERDVVRHVAAARGADAAAASVAGSASDRPGPGEQQWQQAAREVNDQVTDVWVAQSLRAQDTAEGNAAEVARTSRFLAAVVGGVSVLAIAFSVLTANRVIRRLRRLRRETLHLADELLPELMGRLAAGERVDPAAATPRLDFGGDEIGAVAGSFEHAAGVAIDAALAEARARDGVKAVFLNIAHRSQVVVHQQLEILDEAEHRQEDPALLDTLFQLDHLVTRERRNAENLIILGGGEVGRRWRTAIPLMDVVRSALAEAEDYERVRIARLPEVHVAGSAVADIVHLIAELVDNATSFSPPLSRVDIRGDAVGRGVVVEIEDQGLGMTPQQLALANALLVDSREYDLSTLGTDSRLGLFVVSRLAKRSEITVKLSESPYGGVRAIVLLPSALLADMVPAPASTAGPHRLS
ncbi:sensor histidine kinase [Nocardia neocaledoniensis]|uniref:sensor histidine kinase n=1 Tax=Nocardia neocaledoniensis TaxID=236511 RepID=UPI0024590ABC|nr:ATP-binding protein [Nocardia neocaledoniensis]